MTSSKLYSWSAPRRSLFAPSFIRRPYIASRHYPAVKMPVSVGDSLTAATSGWSEKPNGGVRPVYSPMARAEYGAKQAVSNPEPG